jgi:uncharacterized protein YndB with AHSA1/START domain
MKYTEIARGTVRAVADLAENSILATVEIAAPPERVFQALTSQEIVRWWVRPGVFDTAEWAGEVQVGGRWRAAGTARGKPYVLEGEFLVVDSPHKLVHTWHLVGTSAAPTTVTYVLDRIAQGTRITLRHTGFASSDACMANCVGWETSFAQLSENFERNE